MKTFGPVEIALFLVVAGLLFGYRRRLQEILEQINRGGGPGGPAATPAADPFTYFRRWGRTKQLPL